MAITTQEVGTVGGGGDVKTYTISASVGKGQTTHIADIDVPDTSFVSVCLYAPAYAQTGAGTPGAAKIIIGKGKITIRETVAGTNYSGSNPMGMYPTTLSVSARLPAGTYPVDVETTYGTIPATTTFTKMIVAINPIT